MTKTTLNNTALTEVLARMRARADNAYCDYINQSRRDECLGWEIKAERGRFGEAELKAHCAAAEKLGRHRALHEAAKMLDDALGSPPPTKTPQGDAETPRAAVEAIVNGYLALCDRKNPDGSSCEDVERDLIEPIVALIGESTSPSARKAKFVRLRR